MKQGYSILLLVVTAALAMGLVVGECCSEEKGAPELCGALENLEEEEKAEILAQLGPDCEGINLLAQLLEQDDDDSAESSGVEKRKPNFIRFGKRKPNYIRFGKRKPNFIRFVIEKRKPNFLRFGKRKPNFLRFGKRKPNFLRFGKRKPNFLRFGKRKPNFLRFGKRNADAGPNFLRFGRAGEDFEREMRKPNFLRFGKRWSTLTPSPGSILSLHFTLTARQHPLYCSSTHHLYIPYPPIHLG